MPTTKSINMPIPSADTTDGSYMLGVAVYSFSGCLWAQASYGLGSDDEMTYRCGMACSEKNRAATFTR